MSKELALTIVKAGRSYDFSMLVLSGGEALINFKELLEVINFAANLGYLVWVETNVYWAGSLSRARRRMMDLKQAGTSQLVISTDLYHLPFIPFERVAWAIWAAEEIGVGYHMDVTRSQDEKADARLISQLRMLGVEPGYWEPIPFGRGRDLPKEVFSRYRLSEIPPCDGLTLAFDPWGNASCCCNFRIHPQGSKLHLGSINLRGFDEIARDFVSSPYLTFIVQDGLKQAPLDADSTYTGVCEVCCQVFNDGRLTKWMVSTIGIHSHFGRTNP